MAPEVSARRAQAGVGAGVMLVGAALAVGALDISSAAGYGGVGPNFLPWLVAVALLACGALLLRQALRHGFEDMPEAEGVHRAWWPGLLWVSAGLLSNAALISSVGFTLSCSLCYVLAAQGLRRAEGQTPGARTWLVDAVSGLLLSAPVYWLFTGFLGIQLPALVTGGWL